MLSVRVRLSYEQNRTQKSKLEDIFYALLATISLDFASNGKSQQNHLLGGISGRQALPWPSQTPRQKTLKRKMPSIHFWKYTNCQLDLTWFQFPFQAFRQYMTKTEWDFFRCFMGNLGYKLRKKLQTTLSPLLQSWSYKELIFLNHKWISSLVSH